MIAIPLHNRDGDVVAHTLVDDEDAAIAEFRWGLKSTGGYAYRRPYEPGTGYMNGVSLHRQLLGLVPGDGLEVDHINRDRLDNRRANLRVVTHAQNQQNMSAHRDSTSRHRGVSWDEHRGKWRANVYLHGRQHALGRFDTEEEAALVASDFRAEHMPFAVEV